jgi:hypothetical protein
MADHLQPEEESEPDANGMHYFFVFFGLVSV